VGELSGADNLPSTLETLRPDLLLLEWELPGWHTEKLMATLQATSTRPVVIVLGNQSHFRDLAFSAGADAFVSKSDPPERLLAALRNVMRR
jgi:DNA-binding response OmpR family regulator